MPTSDCNLPCACISDWFSPGSNLSNTTSLCSPLVVNILSSCCRTLRTKLFSSSLNLLARALVTGPIGTWIGPWVLMFSSHIYFLWYQILGSFFILFHSSAMTELNEVMVMSSSANPSTSSSPPQVVSINTDTNHANNVTKPVTKSGKQTHKVYQVWWKARMGYVIPVVTSDGVTSPRLKIGLKLSLPKL